MNKIIQILFAALGISGLIALIYWKGPQALEKVSQLNLGYYLIIILIPQFLVIAFDTLGWKYVIIAKEKKFTFIHLLMTKLAGDSVNYLTPAGNIVGEPVKAHILKRYGVSFLDGMASVYLGKLLMAKGQVLFILIGLSLAFASSLLDKTQLIVGFLVFFIFTIILGVFYYLGFEKGIFNVFLSFLEKIRLNLSFIERQREQLHLFDKKISHFYKNHKKEFGLSIFFFFTGWLIGSIEIYLALHLLNSHITFTEAIMIESLGTIIKGIAFFIPGRLGTQEWGFIFLFKIIANVEEGIALAYSLAIRRSRELLWFGIGLAFLSAYHLDIPFKKKTGVAL